MLNEKNPPLVSVVIPVYNRASTIKETIDSVLSQSYSQFELIVVDDGSKDDLLSVVEGFGDSRIKYVRQQNSGANVARNCGIHNSNGKYVAFLDSDDRFLETHLEDAVRCLGNGKVDVYFTRIIVDRGNGKKFLKPPRAPRENEHISEYLMCDRGFVQTSSVVLRKSIAESVLYTVDLPYGQDVDFAIRLFSAGYKFFMCDEPKVIWNDRYNPLRISSKSNPTVREGWLESIQPQITEKAYWGYRGWFIAKSYAQNDKRLKGLLLYIKALTRRPYGLKLSFTVLLQILLVGTPYRLLADTYLKIKRFF